MSYQTVFQEIKSVQSQLTDTVNQWWQVKRSLVAVENGKSRSDDLLPRRLLRRRTELHGEYERLIDRFRNLIDSYFDGSFIVFSSDDDLKAMMRIRASIRYVQNAFAGEAFLPMSRTLARLNSFLPSG